MHKNEISIEQTCIQDGQEQKYEQLQDDAHITIAVSPVIVIVHFVHIPVIVTNNQIYHKNQQRVEQSANTKPSETLTQDAGKLRATMSLDLYPAHKHEQEKEECVEQCTCQYHGDVLNHPP